MNICYCFVQTFLDLPAFAHWTTTRTYPILLSCLLPGPAASPGNYAHTFHTLSPCIAYTPFYLTPHLPCLPPAYRYLDWGWALRAFTLLASFQRQTRACLRHLPNSTYLPSTSWLG